MDDNDDVMQAMVNELRAFKKIVQPPQAGCTTAAVTDGGVFTGTRSVELHLTDQTGFCRCDRLAKRYLRAAARGPPHPSLRLFGFDHAHGKSRPKANVTEFNLPRTFLPTGFVL
jgi:hypothetical protein